MAVFKASIGGRIIADKVLIADSFIKRAVGLLLREKLGANEGLLLLPCRRVHTHFMKFDIDVLFLSKSGEVLFMIKAMKKGSFSPYIKRSCGVLELQSGAIEKNAVKVSDRIHFS